MSRSQWLRGLVATVLMATGIAMAWGQQAAAPSAASQQKISLHIPSQSVAGALTALGQQSGLTIMLAVAAKSDVISPAVMGDYTADEALKKILGSSDLRAEYLDDKTIAIHAAQADSIRAYSAPKAAPTGSKPPEQRETDASPSKANRTGAEEVPQTDTRGRPVDQKGVPEILIKGSRVMNVDVVRTEDDVQPYTVITSSDIEMSGAANVEEVLRQQLTMNATVQTNSQAFGSPAGATSTINLRGLGSNETLILIDGRRSAGITINGSTNQTDINGIPLSAIDRIEVLPSSASAIYGGAAVGGVVNIILKKKFTGGEFSYSFDNTTDGSAPLRTINGSYGFSAGGGRTQLMLSGQYSNGTPLLLRERSSLFEKYINTIYANSPGFLVNPANPFKGATPNVSASTATNLVLDDGTPLNSRVTSVPVGTAPGTSPSAGLLANAGLFNLTLSPGTGPYGLSSPYGTVPTTKAVFGTLRQDLFAGAEVFTEVASTTDAGRTYVNPFSAISFTVPSAAPENPFRQNVLINFPSNVNAPVTSNSVTHSLTVGLLAPVGFGWMSEFDYTWSKNSFEYQNESVDATALTAALRSGSVNPFVDTIAYPPSLDGYLSQSSYSGYTTLNDLSLRVSGHVGSLPGGEPILTIGIEHRKEGSGTASVGATYPLNPQNNAVLDYFGQSQSTNSLYAEGTIPIVEALNEIPAVSALELQLAARSEHYTVHAGTPFAYILPVANRAFNPPDAHSTISYTSTNPTVGIKFKPIPTIAFRSSYASAFLPPTPAQLLRNPTLACSGAPCASIVDPSSGQSYLVAYNAGGNPDLQPQKAKDWDVGLIWEPNDPVLRGLRVDLEWFRIQQPNYITTPTIQQIVDDPRLASRVSRDPTTGRVIQVDDSPINANTYKTSGYDISLRYRRATSLGVFGADAETTITKYDLRQYSFESPLLDYAGYPSDGGEAKMKGFGTLSWEVHGFMLSWSASYYSSYWQHYSPGSPSAIQNGRPLSTYTSANGSFTVPHQTYHDLHLSYRLGGVWSRRHSGFLFRALGHFELGAGVHNVFNSLPPLDSAYGPYYYSPYGDPRLRTYSLTIRGRF